MSRIREPLRERFSIAQTMRIGHASLNVSDIQRSVDFYRDILGFNVVGRPSDEKAFLSTSGGSHLVELLQATNPMHDTIQQKKRAGLYHFAVLLPERKYLADMLQNLRDNRDKVHFDGLADHLVSESIYIRDPDFNGIEIYCDRPSSEWRWNGSQVEMATIGLDTENLLQESTSFGWKEMPTGTTIGHVHLHVQNLAKAMNFYHEILGLNLTATVPNAAFFAAGRYHHHIATNTWLGTDIAPASPNSVGLNHYSIELSNKKQLDDTIENLSKHNIELQEQSEESNSVMLHDNDGIAIQLYSR
ncbi:VOC family protein [Candidatus Nitrososphaera sp. FF02]|uniref:VOC family protein n=1 Tax=Candidatus Nitrososphaera sp. FF02 TaxID=3398226 RepID=UPI0039ED284B